MRIPAAILVAGLVASACGGGASAPPLAKPVNSPTASSAQSPTPTPDPSVVVVRASANIFGAGHGTPPSPGGGGAGVLPPVWPLPAGAGRIVAFPSVTGKVTPVAGVWPFADAGGDRVGPTDVKSYGGIAGIVHGHNGMFLVGVFLTDAEPADPAPQRLDFTDGENFELLAPELGQVFLIGTGAGHRYAVPAGATRLFLGFADAALYQGAPGWYGNNDGRLEVRVSVAAE